MNNNTSFREGVESEQREITQMERLNFIGEMAASMGHEIRNPITTVRGFLQILYQRERNAKNKEYLNLMLEELDKVNDIISEFIALAKDKAINLETRNLNLIIQSIHHRLEKAASESEKSMVLELGTIPDSYLDEEEIRKLITHLFNNGLEAMTENGTITIRTYLKGEDIILEVEDEGTGMDQNIIDKIGTPFFTTKENATGLGLAICYSIAYRHNARIKINSNSEGTNIQVFFRPILD